PRFTKNKQVVRDLQSQAIQKYLKNRLGALRYFGLPSDEMKDIIDWRPFFSEFVSVERGIEPDAWERQHILMLSAFKRDVLSKVTLLRGDIDRIILDGKDVHGNVPNYPFDVVTLDYSGGLLYRDQKGKQYRLDAIRELIRRQAQHNINYLLFISSNLDHCKDAEVQGTIQNLKTELLRYGTNAKEVIDAYMNHQCDEARLKIYISYFINQVAAGTNYNCETEHAVFYLGNQDTRMMNFRFWLKYDPRTTAPRYPRESLAQMINSP
ncbi:unnamed protein product, partial [marine sediment metagenome]